MYNQMKRPLEILALAAIAAMNGSLAMAGPPGPPVIPATPVGGTEITMATAVAIAGYGYWKTRK